MGLLQKVINLEGFSGIVKDDMISLRFINDLDLGLKSFFHDKPLNDWIYVGLDIKNFFQLGGHFFMIYYESEVNKLAPVGFVPVESGDVKFDDISISFGKPVDNSEVYSYLKSIIDLGFSDVPSIICFKNKDYEMFNGDFEYSLMTHSDTDFSNIHLTTKAIKPLEDYNPKYFI